MKVAAIIVTKGDQNLTPVLASLPEEWETVVWDNSKEEQDLAVYGRYAAIARTDAELIYTQDDDCVVSDPQAIVDALRVSGHPDGFKGYWEGGWRMDTVVCNMPSEFRHEFYEDHALVGFGACFHRDVPAIALGRYAQAFGIGPTFDLLAEDFDFVRRTCDIIVTALTPRVLVNVPYENLPWAYHWDRMYRQPEHLAERARMLDLVTKIR